MTRLTRNSLVFFLVWPVVFVTFLFLLPVPKESPTAQAKPLRKPAPKLAEGFLGRFENSQPESDTGIRWYATGDSVRGGTSTADLAITANGANGTAFSLRITGEIKDGFQYPFAGAGLFPGGKDMTPWDASGKKELVFFAKGDGKTYRLMLFTLASDIPAEKAFATTGSWQEVRIPLDSLAADMTRFKGIFFSASPGDGAFQLDVDEVRFQ